MNDVRELFDPVFWEEAWQKAAAMEKKRDAREVAQAWSRRARNYDKNVGSESGWKRVEDALVFLDSHNVPPSGLKILDLGCGPGNFAVAFARRGHTVAALDPADKMLEIVEEKIKKMPEIAGRITTVLGDWNEIDLKRLGWEKHFDLVFASMTPGVHDVATLKKAMNASRQYMYLSRFAGPRKAPLLRTVWRELTGSEYHNPSLDIVFPLNWLYSSGYRPVLQYHHWEREHRQTVEEALEEILASLALRMPVDDRTKKRVRQIIEREAVDGYVTEQKGATAAMLLWRVDRELV